MADLTTIIVSYNTRADLLECLATLHAHAPQGGHEIIVVDNASTDGTVAAVRHDYPAVTLVEAGRNLGFAAANNLGLETASGDLVLLLNSDTLVSEGAIDALVRDLRADASLAAVGPRIVDGSGRAELSFGRMMTPWNELRQKAIVGAQARGIRLAQGWVERATRRVSYPDWVSGACLLVWRRDAMAAGLLDERYFLYAEDVDFCAALRALGKRIRFSPGAQIVHLRGRSGQARPAATARAYQRSPVRFYEKHHPRWAGLLRWYLRLRRRLPD
jgi:N-acetylglucosaminyl-diphospho-decaprenol L-rhamnosyltransferase